MKRIAFPTEWTTDEWYGFTRHHFEIDGCKAWVVEPKHCAGDGRWSWCTVWPEAFVERVGIVALLEHGFYHAHVDAFKYKASPAGIDVMRHFQDKLVSLGLSPKANLIGMSWGGFFSLRYAEENPERIAAIYLDAPVCNAADDEPEDFARQQRLVPICEQFGMTPEQLQTSKLNPINNIAPIIKAQIPVLAAMGEHDIVVLPHHNIDILARRFQEAGYPIKVMRRPDWGHHPHGLDDASILLDFHCAAREK